MPQIIDLTLPVTPGTRGVETESTFTKAEHGWNASTWHLQSVQTTMRSQKNNPIPKREGQTAGLSSRRWHPSDVGARSLAIPLSRQNLSEVEQPSAITLPTRKSANQSASPFRVFRVFRG